MISLFLKNLTASLIILVILHLFNFIDVSIFIDFRYLVPLIFLLLGLIAFLYINKKQKNYFFISKHLFVAGLILLGIASLDFQTLRNFELFNLIIHHLNPLQFYIAILTAIFGFFAIFFKKEEIKKEITEEEKKEKELTKQKKKEEGGDKNIIYYIGMGIIIVLGVVFRIYGITSKSIWYDEGLSISAAQNISQGLGNVLMDGSAYSVEIYHYYLSLFYTSSSEFWVGVLANIPFFILTTIVIYFFGKTVLNKNTGILAATLFSFSWFAIIMAREIRFYEMFIFFFTTSIYFLYLGYINLSVRYKKFCWYFVISCICLLISLHLHSLAFFVFYGILLWGLLKYLNQKQISYPIIYLSFLALLVGNVYRYGVLNPFNVIQDRMLQWFTAYYEGAGYLAFFEHLTLNGYYYLYAILGILAVIAIWKRTKPALFLLCLIVIPYLVISHFGVGYPHLMRYYYMIIPFLILATSYSLCYSLEYLKNYGFWGRVIPSTCILIVVVTVFWFGIGEASITGEELSRYKHHNLNYEEISEIVFDEKYEDYKIVGDNHFAFVSFLYTGEKIDNYLLRHNTVMKRHRIQSYTQIPATTHYDLYRIAENTDEKVLFVNDERRFVKIEPFLNRLESYEKIYSDDVNENFKIEVLKFD